MATSSAFLTVTTKRFTGQYHESSLPGGEGLSYYNVRASEQRLRVGQAEHVWPERRLI